MYIAKSEHYTEVIERAKNISRIGSENLTGEGLAMKGENKRNFEAGILTNDPQLSKNAIEHFDSVWRGSHCKSCLRKAYCDNPIAQMV